MIMPVDLEAIAMLIHQGWMDYQRAKGVVWGPQRTSATHPHFLSWQDLDTESQNQDRFIASVVLYDWRHGRLQRAQLPAAIHEAWADWSWLQNEHHPHARPYDEAHADGDDEHTRQAALIAPFLPGVALRDE